MLVKQALIAKNNAIFPSCLRLGLPTFLRLGLDWGSSEMTWTRTWSGGEDFFCLGAGEWHGIVCNSVCSVGTESVVSCHEALFFDLWVCSRQIHKKSQPRVAISPTSQRPIEVLRREVHKLCWAADPQGWSNRPYPVTPK